MKASTHYVKGTKKERTGFGVWSTIIIRVCPTTSKELRIRKNWHGPKPKGGIYCPYCSQVIDL